MDKKKVSKGINAATKQPDPAFLSKKFFLPLPTRDYIRMFKLVCVIITFMYLFSPVKKIEAIAIGEEGKVYIRSTQFTIEIVEPPI